MTSQKDQIQSLIADIEQALGKEKPKTPWIKASETESQRQALVRAQAYLMSLQQSFEAPGGWGPVDPSTGQIAATETAPPVASGPTSDTSAENVLQALLTEMKFLKSSALQPLRLEMDSLREERDQLNQEVKSLAEQRNQEVKALAEQRNQALLESSQQDNEAGGSKEIDQAQLNDFLQVLMAKLQENLTAQVNQTLGQLESEHSAAMAKLTAATEIEILELKPTGQIEEIRQIQSRSDQLLANIDSTLQRMFETLQTNIDSYQLSLNEGIDNMHRMGRQGEVIVRSLVDHLTQQLGQTVPPEPAFFPARTANVIADATPETPTDTVSSLNEILAETASVADLEEEAAQDTAQDTAPAKTETPGVVTTSPAPDTTDASATNTADTPAENYIRQDGTIDLDLLKLDIDRSEDDPTLTRDDLMIDAAVADAQVAATEDDSEIEAKVKPTADAAFLADLTFDELVVDSALAGPDISVSEVSVPDLVVADTLSVQEAAAHSPASPPADGPDEPTNEPTLAAVLPDFGTAETSPPPSADDPEPEQTTVKPTEQTPEHTAEEASDTEGGKLESAVVPDLPDSEDLAIESSEIDDVLSEDLVSVLTAANEDAERTAAETIDSELDDLSSDLEEAIVFEADPPPLTPLAEADAPLDSASIPDPPTDDEAEPEEVTHLQTALQTTPPEQASPVPQDITQFPPNASFEASLQAIDAPAEDASPDSALEQPASEAPESSSDESSSDESSSDESSSDESSSDESSTGEDSEAKAPNQPAADLPPADFDDDLDFFQADLPTPTETAPHETGLDQTSENSVENTSALTEAPSAVATAALPDVWDEVSDPEVQPEVDSEPQPEPTEPDEGDDDPTGGEPADWFLGLDLGATGLSAVLINQRGEQVYPLCWNIAGDSEANRFRLPAVVQIEPQTPSGPQLGSVGPVALQQAMPVMRNLKLMVKAGIPNGPANEPRMQWSDHTALPLSVLQGAIEELLKTLRAEHTSCRAVGLKNAALRRALASLQGVIVGYPTNWPDTYSFNIRESILAAGLVSLPDQVFFVEEAIAALLSALPAPSAAADLDDNQQPGLYNCNWSGGTVIISAGAILTETAVVNLPEELEQLSYHDFVKRGYTYAGDGIDQDIICQLLHLQLPSAETSTEGAGPSDSTVSRWESLGLGSITLPQPGEADRVTRHRLRQRLNDSALGREAVMAARELKIALQEEEEVEVELGDHTWVITRKDLETKVFLPYIQRINRQINSLLSKKNTETQAVKQVVCTGGSASLGAIARWLRQKFPNATIIQDTYTGEYSNSCSRVAYGLANLCHYPKVLDANRHQYNDYFLLLELLRILPEQPLPAGGILHLLEQRGINTQACQAHVLALIEGHLPPGLVPTSGDRPLISAQSSDIATYRALSELPLFRKQGGQIYIADPQQGEKLRTHLEGLLATKSQSLSEPMTPAALMATNVQG